MSKPEMTPGNTAKRDIVSKQADATRSARESEPDAGPGAEPVRLLKNIGTLAVCPDDGTQDGVALVSDAAILWRGDTLLWAGSRTGLEEKSDFVIKTGPENKVKQKSQPGSREKSGSDGNRSGYDLLPVPTEVFDAGGRLVIPGLVDCHTHLAFGGWRPDEFEMRSLGKTYEEIAEAGGGILSTMKATREAGEDDLVGKSRGLLAKISALGVTTVECKSGYGLTVKDELKQLRVYRRLQSESPMRIISTFLGAHAFPPEYRNDREGYIRLVMEEMLPRVAEEQLARFCDAFVDAPAFTNDEARRILTQAKSRGLTPKLHADQLTGTGGAELAAELGAVSADHLECISEKGIRALKAGGTVAVSLPLATWYLRKNPLPARSLIGAGVPVAVSTDFNPGSAPSYHLPMAMHMACTLQHMSPAEVLKGATIIAARALDIGDVTGSLESGKKADFVELETASVNQWMYHFQSNCTARVWSNGACIHDNVAQQL